MNDDASRRSRGVALALCAYCIWGFFPLYFKALSGVTAGEVLAHRILWSFASLALFVAAMRTGTEVWAAFRSRRVLLGLLVSTLLISVNWFVFIVAVNTNHVLDASLGYYITPLVNVLLGRIVLKERLRPLQKASVALAALGVLVKTLSLGQLPVVALILAVSFGAYGLARKITPVGAVAALTVETALLVPAALAWAVFLAASGQGVFLTGAYGKDTLLVLAGVLTAIPLALYGAALRRLPLATVGILQYLVPTLQFLLAVYVFGEPFALGQLSAFLLIWAGVLLYSWDALTASKKALAQ